MQGIVNTRRPAAAVLDTTRLTDAEAAAYLWLKNRNRCVCLAFGEHAARVLPLSGELLVNSPEQALLSINSRFGLLGDNGHIKGMIEHPIASRYSKDSSRIFGSDSRREELTNLEIRFGSEADAAMAWLLEHTSTSPEEIEVWPTGSTPKHGESP